MEDTDLAVAKIVQEVVALVSAMADELEAPVSAEDVVVVFSRAASDLEVAPGLVIKELKARFLHGEVGSDHVSEADGLNDAAYAEAAAIMRSVFRQLDAAADAESFGALVCALLSSAIAQSPFVVGHPPAHVDLVLSAPAEHMSDLAPGRVYEVRPENEGMIRTIVVLSETKFGIPIALLPAGVRGETIAAHDRCELIGGSKIIYIDSGDDAGIRNGLWCAAGSAEDLSKSFPDSPERYHRPEMLKWAGITSVYGQAESPSGEMRELTQLEAESVGLADGSYSQSYDSCYLATLLQQGKL